MEIRNKLLEKAYQIALQAHEGQKDKAGQPYILHPVHVAEEVEALELKVIALLHDVLEDSTWTREQLVEAGIPESLVEVVSLLTHDLKAYPDYLDYIERISRNAMARKVKLADLRHNMDISRIPSPTLRDYARLEKYRKAYAILEQAERNEHNE